MRILFSNSRHNTMDTVSKKFPPQTKFIVGNEACERFSFYGIKSILAAYITSRLFMNDDQVVTIVHLFIAINYLMPLVGGWISDRFWGRYKTILWVSLFYCLGHGVLALSDLSDNVDVRRWVMLSGLMCIAFGSGGIKPCVSAFMGDQFKPEQSFLLKKAYAAFYWSINFGSFFAFLAIPWVMENHGWSWAFVIPGITMSIATTVFWLGRRQYLRVPPSGRSNAGGGIYSVIWYCIKNRSKGVNFWESGRQRFTEEQVANAQSVVRILKIFALIPAFWALFEQTASSWVIQGGQMETFDLNLGFTKWTVTAPQFQAANPTFVMILIPLITVFVYPRMKWMNNPLRRMGVGMIFGALAFGIVAWYQSEIDGGRSMSLAWQVFPYLVLTIGEILVSTTGLEFAFTQAPAKLKSVITSYWNLTIAVGNFLVFGLTWSLSRFGDSHAVTSGRFLSYGLATLVVALLFMWISSRYVKTSSQKN